jgi:acetolactate synthase-1/2/3 large subunit
LKGFFAMMMMAIATRPNAQTNRISPAYAAPAALAQPANMANPMASPPQAQALCAHDMSGAKIFCQALVDSGVTDVFGYPGGVILPIYDALADYPQLKHYLVRHEQGATHMAEGYAKSTGKPGVVLVTSGPGATNIVTGVANAYYDSTPLVVFTGNVPTHMLGNDAFQEADILSITRACTKHNIIVRDVKDLCRSIKEAFHVATTGRPGPVVVDLPKDVITAMATYNFDATECNLPAYNPAPAPVQPADIDELLALLAEAKQPVILAGGGVVNSGANAELLAFAEHFNLPVASSLMGLGGFPSRHPLFMGFAGMHGMYWANIAIAKADLVVVIGNRLNERQTGKADRFARNAKIVHIDLDPSNLGKNVPAFLPIAGDVKEILQHTLSQADVCPHDFTDALASRAAWLAQIEAMKRRKPMPIHSGQGCMTPQYAIERVMAALPADNAFVTTEVGQHQMWTAQRFNIDRPRSFVTSGGLGTMGFGFPAAIGIQVAHPTATVVEIAGDGSFQMTLQELATAAAYNLPVKVVIINNSRLGMIRQWQDKMYGRQSEAAMGSPDYVLLAKAFGGEGFVVDRAEDADAILAQAMAITDRPVIVDMRVAETCDVYPWVPAGSGNEEMLSDTPAT